MIRYSHASRKLLLPDLRAFNNEGVWIFSDYGGESSGDYYTYSAIVCGSGYTGPFNQKMKAVREKHQLGEIEIAYKSFGTGQVRRALLDYLTALDRLPGFLCTLLVHKRVTTLFGHQEKATLAQLAQLLDTNGLGKRKHHVAEKLLRVVHFTAFLTGLLTHDGQKVFWMSDNDAICANAEAHVELLKTFNRVLPIYTRPDCTIPLVGGARPFNLRSVEMMDLLSAADIAAGATAACFPSASNGGVDADPQIKRGADDVLRWLSRDGIGLKKAIYIARLDSAGTGIENGTVDLKPTNTTGNFTFIPIFM